MVCLEEEHIKRFGLTKAVILGVLIVMQKQADMRKNNESYEDSEGCMWFFCTLESLGAIINLTRANTHRHMADLVKAKVLLRMDPTSISTDRRILYHLQMEKL